MKQLSAGGKRRRGPAAVAVLAHAAGLGSAAALTGCVLDTSNDSSLSLQPESVLRERLGQLIASPTEELQPGARETAVAGHPAGRPPRRVPLAAGEVVVADGPYYEVQVQRNGTATVLDDVEPDVPPDGFEADAVEPALTARQPARRLSAEELNETTETFQESDKVRAPVYGFPSRYGRRPRARRRNPYTTRQRRLRPRVLTGHGVRPRFARVVYAGLRPAADSLTEETALQCSPLRVRPIIET